MSDDNNTQLKKFYMPYKTRHLKSSSNSRRSDATGKSGTVNNEDTHAYNDLAPSPDDETSKKEGNNRQDNQSILSKKSSKQNQRVGSEEKKRSGVEMDHGETERQMERDNNPKNRAERMMKRIVDTQGKVQSSVFFVLPIRM